jgi:thiamine pyrophosphate-dependent acetolactate synthase large subunit-like protein
MRRSEIVATLCSAIDPSTFVIAPLGYVGREIWRVGNETRAQTFFCMGSMGSVIPFSMGISLAMPKTRVFAVEGDGSLLMNLGCLVTLKRYKPLNLTVIIFDNRIYESTGGQLSQPSGFYLADLIEACGIDTQRVTTRRQLSRLLAMPNRLGSRVLIVETVPEPPCPRIPENPLEISARFSKRLRSSELNTQ